MGKRSTARRIALQALYACDNNNQTPQQALQDVLETDSFIEDTAHFAEELLVGACGKKDEIDKKIAEYSSGWTIDRISMVDRNILRLAIFEMFFHKKNPRAVIIDEAVELAKKFGGADSYKFVNGVLGKMV